MWEELSRLPSTMAETLQTALSGMDLLAKDKAAIRLAEHYADQLDAGADAVKMGPAYLACLESLGMTPRARAAISGKGDPTGDPARNPLAIVRGNRAAREHDASVVDIAAS